MTIPESSIPARANIPGQQAWLGILLCLFASVASAQDWPRHVAPWTIELEKDVNTSPAPHEPSDKRWLHLHRNHPTLPDALQNTIAPRLVSGYDTLDPAQSGIELRYTVHGIPVSDWLSPPFRFVLDIDNPGLSQLQDGIHDLSVDVRGSNRLAFTPWRAFVHLSRDLASGEPYGFSRSVPIINAKQGKSNTDSHFGPGVVYVDPDERDHRGYPLDPEVQPWQEAPDRVALYQEAMAPHTELFHAVQMWWDHPAHANAPFVRGLTPQHGEDHRSLRVRDRHERFPMSDGPRGIGWMSPYVSGQVDSRGRFAFAEAGGRVGYVLPDGEITTVAGWRVRPDKDPVWWGKPLAQVRRNMENRGNWLDGQGEFLTPLDVAIDPLNEDIWYVVGYEDNVVWKVELPADPRTQEATISIFAGDPGHRAGFADGRGREARFNGPASIVFDPTNDVLYVADQDNDALRRIDRAGQVTTIFGQPGMREQLTSRGVEWTDQLASREASRFEVSATQAGEGARPDIYLPQTVRVDSRGNIILLEIGFGAIRRIDPDSGETVALGEVRQKHRPFDRGWAWLDVDRYGNSGPLDGIYWTKFVSTLPDERFNEVYRWLPPEGGESISLFPRGTGLFPDGWGRRESTNPPHYGWLVAVDPRGGVLLAGGGEHGLTRLRRRRADDPVESGDYWLGRKVWNSGAPVDAPIAATSFALKYGWSGHNHLGLTDAWALDGASDETLLAAFDVPLSIRNDSTARGQWLAFVRPNTHTTVPSVDGSPGQPDSSTPSTSDPVPPDEPTPAPAPVPPPGPPPAPDRPCNILGNGSVDRDTAGWASRNTDLAIVADAHSGSGALTLRDGSARILGDADADTAYRITGYAKSSSGVGGSGVGVDFLAADGTEISEVLTSLSPSAAYRPFSLEAVTPPGTVQARLWIYAAGRSLHVDELDIRTRGCAD